MGQANGRNVAGAVALVGLLLLAGCVQLGVHSTVGADGTIEEYRMYVNVSRTAYGFLEQGAEEEGYDSVGEYVLAQFDESAANNGNGGSLFAGVNRSDVGSIEYDETIVGDRVSMRITVTDFNPPAGGPVTITERDGLLVYEDLTFANESMTGEPATGLPKSVAAGLAVDYRLTMPGEIVESNADVVDGNTAEWHASGADAFTDTRIYAVSEKPTSASLPGFGVGVALSAIVAAVATAIRQRS